MADQHEDTHAPKLADSVEPSVHPPPEQSFSASTQLNALILSPEALELLGGLAPRAPAAPIAAATPAAPSADAQPAKPLAAPAAAPIALGVEHTPADGTPHAAPAPAQAAAPQEQPVATRPAAPAPPSEEPGAELAARLPGGSIPPPATARITALSGTPAGRRGLPRKTAFMGTAALVLLIGAAFYFASDKDAPPPLVPVAAAPPAAAPAAPAAAVDHAPTPTAPAAATARPAIAAPAAKAVQATPRPAVHLPLDQEHVDQLGFAELRAQLEKPDRTLSAGLVLWAQFRLAYAFGDEAAAGALREAAAGLQRRMHRGRLTHPPRDPLERAASMGAVLFTLPHRDARALLHALSAPHETPTPQLRLVSALMRANSSQGLWGEARTELSLALEAAPQMVDGQLLLGQAELDSHESRAGIERLSHLVITGSDETAARAAQLLWHARAFAALRQLLEQRFGEASSKELLAQWQSAAPPLQGILRQMGVRIMLWRGQLVPAFELAFAQAQQMPQDVAAQWEMVRLAWLLGLGDVPKPAAFLAGVPAAQRPVYALWTLDWGSRVGRTEAVTAGQAALEQLGSSASFFADVARAKLGITGIRPRAERGARRSTHGAEEGLWLLGLPTHTAPAEHVLALEEALHQADEHHQHALPASHARRGRHGMRGAAQTPTIDTLATRAQPPALLAQTSPVTSWLTLALLDTAQQGRRPALAARAAETLLWTDPLVTDPVALVLDWATQLTLARSAGALPAQIKSTLERLTQELPRDDRPLHSALGLAQLRDDGAEELRLLDALLVRHVGDTKLTLASASALHGMGRDDEALARLNALATIKPEVRDANFLFVYAQVQRQRDPAHAIASLKTALASAPQPRAFILKAQLEQARNEHDEALHDLSEGERMFVDSLPLATAHAQLLVAQEAYDDAANLLQRRLVGQSGTDIERAAAYETLGDARHEQGLHPQARRAFEQALQAHPSPQVLLKLARIELRDLGATQSAQERLSSLTRSEPRMPEPYYLLGLALKDLGRSHGSEQALETYLKLAPDGEHAGEVRELLHRTP